MNNTATNYIDYARPITQIKIQAYAEEIAKILPVMIDNYADYEFTTISISDYYNGFCDIRIRSFYGELREAFCVHYRKNKRYYTTGKKYSEKPIESRFLALCDEIQTEHMIYKSTGFNRLTITVCKDCLMVRNGYGGCPDADYPIDIYKEF